MKVLVCDPIAAEGIDILRQHAEVDVKTGLAHDDLLRAVPGYAALVVRSQTYIGADVIEAADGLRVIGRAGVGVDNIDVEAASRRGVVVVNAPTANNVAAAEHTIALLLSLARFIPQAHRAVRVGKLGRSPFLGSELRGKTLGIIGLGNIGSEVARRARFLEMTLLGFDPFVSAEHARSLGVTPVALEELLAESDFVTVHVPLNASTAGLLNWERLALMKPGARLVNCARGGVVDEEALLEAVRSGRLAGAALDVFVKEPPTGSPLLQEDRILVTPHLGGSTEEAQVGVAVDVAQQIVAVLQEQPVQYAVNAPAFGVETVAAIGPYLVLAEKLGLLLSQLADGPIDRLEVVYHGRLAERDTAPIRAALAKGLLQASSPAPVSLVNALLLASNRGLQIDESRSSQSLQGYSSLITLRAPSASFVRELAGTVVEREPHIVRIDDYWVDVVPVGGYLLIGRHVDRLGVVGCIGTMLGDANINISFVQIGRGLTKGEAMMILGVDDAIPESVYQQILQVAEIRSARVVRPA